MRHIKSFSIFNESILSNLKSTFGSKFGIESENSTPKLKKYKISYKKKNDSHFYFFHNKRVIAELYQKGMHLGSPLFKMDIYLYHSECPSKSQNIEKRFDNQDEQPYSKITKGYYNTENAIDDLIRFWSTQTESGKSLNKDLKIRL